MALSLRTLRRSNVFSFRGAILRIPQCTYADYEEVKDIVRKSTKEKYRDHQETPRDLPEDPLNPPKGRVWGKSPFKIELKAGKTYHWCTCGYSHNQPFCDGSHKALYYQQLKAEKGFRSHKFTVEETKEYWLCQCKQTNNRPFCDGSHKGPDVQALKQTSQGF